MPKRPTMKEVEAIGASAPRKSSRDDGKAQSRLGRDLEQRLDAQHAFYKTARRGVMARQYPQAIYQRGGGVIQGRAVVDYIGFVDGFHVALEAKRCASGRLVLGDASKVERHQLDFLDWWVMCRGTAIYVVAFGANPLGDCVVVPAAAVGRALRDGVRSWSEEHALAAGVACRGTDWAEALGRLAK
jgi:hypothetical protein